MVYYSRSDWGAAPAKSITPWKPGMPTSLTVHAVGGAVGEQSNYLTTVKSIQSHAFGKGLSDIDYNFLVSYTGDVYEGRGPGVQSGAQGVGNDDSMSVCYLDYGDGDVPFTDAAKNAIMGLRAAHVHGGGSAPIHPHRYWNGPNTAAGHGEYVTSCPGDEISAWCNSNPTLGGAGTPPSPPPPQAQEDVDVSAQLWYPLDKRVHRWWVDPNTGHLQHMYAANAVENMTVKYGKGQIGPLDPTQAVCAMIVPETLGSAIDVTAIAPTGWVVRWHYQPNLGWVVVPTAPAV